MTLKLKAPSKSKDANPKIHCHPQRENLEKFKNRITKVKKDVVMTVKFLV